MDSVVNLRRKPALVFTCRELIWHVNAAPRRASDFKIYLFPAGLNRRRGEYGAAAAAAVNGRAKNSPNSFVRGANDRHHCMILHLKKVGNAGSGWMQREHLFTSMKVGEKKGGEGGEEGRGGDGTSAVRGFFFLRTVRKSNQTSDCLSAAAAQKHTSDSD